MVLPAAYPRKAMIRLRLASVIAATCSLVVSPKTLLLSDAHDVGHSA